MKNPTGYTKTLLTTEIMKNFVAHASKKHWSKVSLHCIKQDYTLLSGADVTVQEGGFTWRSVCSLVADILSLSCLTDFERRRSFTSSFFTLRSYGSNNLHGYNSSPLHIWIQLHINLPDTKKNL